jgi:Adenylylsulphate kinase
VGVSSTCADATQNTDGEDRTLTTAKIPLSVQVVGTPNPVVGSAVALSPRARPHRLRVRAARPQGFVRAGDLCGLTGVDAPYEAPAQPDLVLHSGSETVEISVERVMQALGARFLHPPQGELRGE